MRILYSKIWHSLLTSWSGWAAGCPARSRVCLVISTEKAPGRSLRADESIQRVLRQLPVPVRAPAPFAALPAWSERFRSRASRARFDSRGGAGKGRII
jgi:hypothetical protein